VGVAIGMTWSAAAGAIPSFTIAPNPVAATPGGAGANIGLAASDTTDSRDWFAFIVTP
jgi:hypothetical protein